MIRAVTHIGAAMAALLLLTGCGFTPVHQSASTRAALAEQVQIVMENGEDVNDRDAGYFIQQGLYERLGRTTAAAHVLTITPKSERLRLGITDQDFATRYDTVLSAAYKLTDAKTGELLDSGEVEAASSFGVSDDPYAIEAADNQATVQVADQLADRLLARLAIYYAQNK